MVREYKWYMVGGNEKTKPGCCDVYLTNIDLSNDINEEELNKLLEVEFDQTTPESSLIVKLHLENKDQIEHLIGALKYYTE